MRFLYCLDASVIINSYIDKEEFHNSSKKLMEIIKKNDIKIILPEIVFPEVASAIARGINDEKVAIKFAETLRKLPNFTIITIDNEISNLSLKFAAKNRLRGCDAIYVAVAYLFNLKLITLDKQQKERSLGLIEVTTPINEIECLLKKVRSD